MTKITGLVLLILIPLILCPAGAAQETATPAPPPTGSGGSVFVGTRGLDNSNYLGKVSEYDAARDGLRPSVGVEYWRQGENYFVDAGGEHRGDAKDQRYGIDLQVDRHFRIRTQFLQYLHRLDHDPLDDLDTAKGGPMVQHTDLAPGVEYMPGYSELNTKMEFAVPGAEWLRFRASHRTFERHGAVQARTMEKCSSCHVKAVTKNIDQRLHDVSGGVSLRFNKVSVDYDYLNRQFNEQAPAPTMEWSASIHPVLLTPVFSNRVSFDNRDGELPYSQVPDTRKERHHVRARVELPKDARLSGAFTSSNAKNRFTGLGVDSWGWHGRLTIPFSDRLVFTSQLKQLDLDSEGVFVDIQEPVALGGPHAGKTYGEVYPEFGSADFFRDSVRSRNRFSWKGELSANVAKYTTLRGGYEFIRLKRDHYEVGQTDTNRIAFSFNSRNRNTGAGDFSWRFRYRYENNIDPFLHKHAANPPGLQLEPTPGASPFAGTQYFKIYAAREANLTTYPTQAHSVEPAVTWMPSPKVSASFHYRYRNLENDDLNQSDWNRSVHMPGAELWFAPLERLDFTVAYTFHNERSNSLFGIAVYDG